MPKAFVLCSVLLLTLAALAAPARPTGTEAMLAAGAPPTAPAAPAAGQSADVAIIVNQRNPLRDISFRDLRKYFMAERSQWPDGSRVIVAMRQPPGQPDRAAVLRTIYSWNEEYYRTYFRQGRFNESIQAVPKELNTTYNMVQYVHYAPGAIGYVRADQVDYAKVNVLSVDGRKPGEPGYRIK